MPKNFPRTDFVKTLGAIAEYPDEIELGGGGGRASRLRIKPLVEPG